MKNIFWICLFAILINSCKGEGTTTDTPPVNDTQKTVTPPRPAEANGETMQYPTEFTRAFNLLSKEYWVIEFYVKPGDEAARKANKGKWYAFTPDGRYQYGQWEEAKGYGTWGFKKSQRGNAIIRLDATDNMDDEEWEIQGINGSGDAMTWVGTGNFGSSSVIIKAIPLLSMPTKQQFGVE